MTSTLELLMSPREKYNKRKWQEIQITYKVYKKVS
jgi:hypothetical protein